ncbi:hypothetical protein V7S43_015499 [Phytophthora oleae]|uniref:Uncharacterized protein n=1 Tax=Phytophthora oleae TaxID=2107226 RepID=A0ABD3F307_9STRA
MDVILAQLEPQELESRCRDAMNTQLTVMQRALKDALNAIKCAEEVQLASQKLAITLFKDGSELSATLHDSTRLQDELATSLDRVVACSLGHATLMTRLTIETLEGNPTSQKKRKGSSPATKEATAKKQKCSLSTTIKSTAETSGMTTEGAKSSNTLTKALAACSNLTKELEKKKKAVDRLPGLKTLVQHFNTAQNYLDRNSIIDQIEALGTLSVVAEMAVGIMQHGKPQMKRHWVRKFRENISNIQEKFPDSATAFDGSISALDKIISKFPLTIKEGQKLRVRLRGTLEEVKVWKDGQYTVADINQNMSLVAEALESTCPNWIPLTDKTIRDLTTHLRDRLGVFKRSKKRAKRMQKLQMWLDKMELGSQEGSPNGKMPLASNAKATSKKTTQSHAKAQTPSVKSSPPKKIPPGRPGRQNIVIELDSSSTESSDAESTQYGSSVKSERATGSMHVG